MLLSKSIRAHLLFLWLIATLITLLYFRQTVVAERIVVPFDDAYIHFQYARQASLGHPWAYNPNDPLTTGATSLIYPFLLALGLLAGLPPNQLGAWALLIGYLSYITSLGLNYLITHTLSRQHPYPHLLPLISTLLLLLTGAVQWAFFNGMETSLYIVALLAAIAAFVYQRFKLALLATTLSAFVRPEGTFLAVILFTLLFLHFILAQRQGKQLFTRRDWLQLISILLLSFLPYLVNYLVAGDFLSTGAQAKSWTGNVPFRLDDIIISILRDGLNIVWRFIVGPFAADSWLILPGFLLLVTVGWYQLAADNRWWLLTLSFLWLSMGILLSATLITATWHIGRYQIPYLIILYPLATIGGATLLTYLPANPRLHAAIATLLFLITGWTSYQAYHDYRHTVVSMAEIQIKMGEWINHNLPPDARIAIVDAGAIRYFSQRPTVDLIGLTTEKLSPLWRSGIGAVYEHLEQLERPPTHIAVFPNVSTIPYFEGTDIFAAEIYRAEYTDFSPIGAVEATKRLYRIDWTHRNAGDSLHESDYVALAQNLPLHTRIDVADAASEQAVDWTWWESDFRIGHATDLHQLPTANGRSFIDGGRLLTGGATFTLPTQPQQALTLFARSHNQQPNGFDIYVNDNFVGVWPQPTRPGQWVESSFVIPATAITANTATIELRVHNQQQYVSLYHLWAYAGEPTFIPPPLATPTNIQFDTNITLVGHTITTTTTSLQVTLIWQAATRTQTDAKVFVHMYDEAGNIISQHDGYPVADTRPPYSWLAGEYITDTHLLPLPPNFPNTPYQIHIGLYHPQTGIRLLTTNDQDSVPIINPK
ncbi:MAG TPA: hypothetical protein VLL52_12095 [Anaerolineae bacterium]|nr:hypothetical protein [Anaerolineae bacterium]